MVLFATSRNVSGETILLFSDVLTRYPTTRAVMVYLRIVLFAAFTFILSPVVADLDSESERRLLTPPTATPKTRSSSTNAWNADPTTLFFAEVFFGGVAVLYVVVFAIGLRSNMNLASAIAKTLKKVLSEQFAKFGDQHGKDIVRDGAYFFWIYATGRRHTPGLTISVDLARRHDLFSYTTSVTSAPQKDRIIFYLPIAPGTPMEAMTLFLVRKKELARLRNLDDGEAVNAVESMAAKVVDVPPLPSDFVVMTEHVDIAKTLLSEPVRAALARNAANIISLHVTEQGALWEAQCEMSKRLIRLEFTLPDARRKHESVLHDMAFVAVNILDIVATTKLSPGARKSAMDVRKRILTEQQKQEQKARAEEAAARRLEKKKLEEEAVAKLSAEKQRKYEEKKRKKEIASRMRKTIKK